MGKKNTGKNASAELVPISAEDYMKERGPQSELVVLPTPRKDGSQKVARVKIPSIMDGVNMFKALDIDPAETEEMGAKEMGATVFNKFEPVIEAVLPKVMLEPRVVRSDTPLTEIPKGAIRVSDLDENDVWFLVMHTLDQIGGDEKMVKSFPKKPSGSGRSKPGGTRRRRPSK